MPSPPALRSVLSQAWKWPLNDPPGSNEVSGTSSLGNVEMPQIETRFTSSMLLGRAKSIPLTSQIQNFTLVPCWKDVEVRRRQVGESKK